MKLGESMLLARKMAFSVNHAANWQRGTVPRSMGGKKW
jgi:hypothetical protein